MIMFEALFVLTTIDAGTRVARFLVQEAIGKVWRPMAQVDWRPGAWIATTLVVGAWSYFLFTGSIASLWPMLGISNQLLACIALTVGTTFIVRSGRRRYAWVTLVPLTFVSAITLSAGFLRVTDYLLPAIARGHEVGANSVNVALIVFMMTAVLIILGIGLRLWLKPPLIPARA